MADRTITDRLQPSLLDRLTDLEPELKTESRDNRVINLNRLREIVRRDLAWLLNSNNQDTIIDANTCPHAVQSVINYGVRDTSGIFTNENRAEEIRKSIEQAIIRFEPRINPGTLEVTISESEETKQSVVDFNIRAEMWAQPLPIDLYLRSKVDLTTGELSLDRRG